jgi:hypothetical protein
MTTRDVFVPVNKKKLDKSIFSSNQKKQLRLTLVLERTLFDGSNESDNFGDVTTSVGVLG